MLRWTPLLLLLGCVAEFPRPSVSTTDAFVFTDAAPADAAPDRRVDAVDASRREPDAACVPADEACDGRDDDCDGRVDEGLDGTLCYEGPPETRDVGACTQGRLRCTAGAAECEGQSLPREDVCDGLDNDCDGQPDERINEVCFDGPPAQLDVGQCRAGRRRCTDGVLGACAGEVRPGNEICDGLDNDCDGRSDEVEGGCGCPDPGVERPCYTGPPETLDVGACRAGTQRCLETNQWSACADERPPVDERCDAVDDDCDGTPDEGLPLGQGCGVGVGACARAGLTVCGPEGEVRCGADPGAPGLETCDGADDDCDGRTDEGWQVGDRCEAGVGACADVGQLECGPEGDNRCTASAGPPGAELCNGLDDDCDGAADEGELFEACYGGPAATRGVGACRDGVRACGAAACPDDVVPAGERCNGVDDDCDGAADEGLGLGVPCERRAGGCVREGVTVCDAEGAVVCGADSPDADGDGFTCEVDCDDTEPRANPDATEVCDLIDNDCDQQVDEVGGCDCVPHVRAERRYLFCPNGRSYDEGAAWCRQYGANLAIIDSAAEDAWLRARAGELPSQDWWIGLNDRERERDFRWVDGRSPSYTNWGPRQPDDWFGEDCVFLWDDEGFRWNDDDCGDDEGTLCEAPCAPGTDADGDGVPGCGHDCDDDDPGVGANCP